MAAITKIFLVLLSTFCLVSISLSAHIPTNKDVKWWCSNTPHPKLCRRLFKSPSYVPRKKSSFRNRVIKDIIEEALTAQSHNKGLGRKCRNEREKAAWADCITLYQNTISQLNRTVDATIYSSDIDAQTHLSTSLTNLETCRNGFRELGVADFILPQMTNNVSQLIANSLAINKVNGTAEQPASYQDGFPNWVAPGDRKLLQASSPQANIVVAQDGSGNLKTVNEAIDAASKMKRSGRFIIYVKAGTYKENVLIGNSLKNIMLLGDGMKSTIITGSRSVGGGFTTFNSSTLAVTGDGFIARGITFRNTAGPQNGQAVAMRSGSDLSVFYKCGFEGYQDTLYVHSQRQFYRECYIYGTVDFIFGNAAVVLQNCMIYVRKNILGKQNVVTAQGRSDPNQNTGISIHNSRVMASADLRPVLSQYKTYLGRPWQRYSRTVFMQTYLDTLIDPAGWTPWNGSFALDTLYYGEYKNVGPASSTVRRVQWPGYRVVTNAAEASKFTVENFIAGRSWLPTTDVPFTAAL
ncbi:pectinesterase [Ranunculus cassubicifolius]